MARHIRRLALAGVSLAVLLLAGGCQNSSNAVTKHEEDLMRRPVGQTPCRPEAAKAMQEAGKTAAQRANQGGK